LQQGTQLAEARMVQQEAGLYLAGQHFQFASKRADLI
jgi:hypothetical protein